MVVRIFIPGERKSYALKSFVVRVAFSVIRAAFACYSLAVRVAFECVAYAWHSRSNCASFVWHSRVICEIFACRTPMRAVTWPLSGISVIFLFRSRGTCVACRLHLRGIRVDTRGIFVSFEWHLRGVRVVFLSRMHQAFAYDTCGIRMGYAWYSHGILTP